MDPAIPTPTASSTVTSSSSVTPPQPPFRLLELTVISAQDLQPVSKSMRTYAITWIQPNRKLTSRVDPHGHTNPTWNEKFAFRVDDDFLFSDNAAVNVEIYAVSWFRDVLVGTVRVLMCNLITPQQFQPGNIRYVALQVRRSSGTPQGILNMGVTLVDSSLRSMPLNKKIANKKHVQDKAEYAEDDEEDDDNQQLISKIQLWRSLSHGTSDVGMNPGSIVNGSMVNGSIVYGSEVCSDIGPSASIVAAEMAMAHRPCPPGAAAVPTKVLRPQAPPGDSESLILEDFTAEEAAAKGLTTDVTRWRKKAPSQCDDSMIDGHTRRHSDGGLFSCFANAYGYEFTIVCGAGANNGHQKLVTSKSRKKTASETGQTDLS